MPSDAPKTVLRLGQTIDPRGADVLRSARLMSSAQQQCPPLWRAAVRPNLIRVVPIHCTPLGVAAGGLIHEHRLHRIGRSEERQ